MKSEIGASNGRQALQSTGYALFENAIDDASLVQLRDDLERVYRQRRAVQRRNGIANGMTGTCHHLLGEKNSLDALFAALPLHEIICEFFDGPYILNSFGGFLNRPVEADGYIGAVHRDVRTYSKNFKLMANMLIMLDDFTENNGATYLLAGSQNTEARPSDKNFFATAARAFGSAGDILLFDSRIWHAAGRNGSTKPRRALTLTFTRPFIKPQLDYPRYLGEAYIASLSSAARQVLGCDARVPATIDEFYQPPDRRAYKPNQG